MTVLPHGGCDVLNDDVRRAENCHAGRDGDCVWPSCPQVRDGEPSASGRHCPLDRRCGWCDESIWGMEDGTWAAEEYAPCGNPDGPAHRPRIPADTAT